MNVVPPSAYPFGHGFWPFASCAGMKSMDMSIHPAFLHTPYPAYALTHCNAAPVSPMHPGMRSKSDSFTIDAILNRDKKESPVEKSKSPNYQEHEQCKKDIEIISRRHQRIYENSHPYLSPVEKKSSPVSAKKSPESTLKEIEKNQEKTSEGKQTWKQGKGKRVRTIFTPEQLERLETEFEKQQYMVGTERYYLACSLNLTEAQVKVWFQNRRIKWRKQTLEQQQAKLARFDIFKDTTGSESGYSDDEEDKDDKTHKFPTSPDQRCVTAEVPSTSYSPY